MDKDIIADNITVDNLSKETQAQTGILCSVPLFLSSMFVSVSPDREKLTAPAPRHSDSTA